MKKIIVTLLILSVSPVWAQVYQAPTDTPAQYIGTQETKLNTASMPLFKRARLSIKNYIRNKDIKQEEAIQPVEALPTPDEEVVQLSVTEQVTPNMMTLDADNIAYDENTGEIYALGNPIMNFTEQGTVLKADTMVYNTASSILKAYDNVQLIKDGVVMHSDFMQINTNEETVSMDNLRAQQGFLTITARNAASQDEKIILENGRITANTSHVLVAQTRLFNMMPDRVSFDDDLLPVENIFGSPNYKVMAKNISIDAKKNHNVIGIKGLEVYSGEKRVFRFPSITAHAGKDNEYFEANYPEFGTRKNLGTFLGPGFVFDLPNSAALKVIPMIVQNNGFGVGGAAKYRSANNYTEFAYGTAQEKFILRGKQQLDDKLFLQYGSNSYLDDWFMGQNMSKYLAELVYEDDTGVKNSLGEGLDLQFRHRGTLGYAQDGDTNRKFEDIASSNLGTMRAKYMAQILQPLFNYKNSEKKFAISGGVLMQGSTALYGTGDTQMIGRVGPNLRMQYKNWSQDLTYFQSAFSDNTPMPLFDKYRFGRSNVRLQEVFWVNKYLTLVWRGSFNLLSDAPNGRPMQECGFYVAVGPDDMKFSLGYDFIREQTFFDMSFALNVKDSSLDFERMEIKNADRLSSKNTGKMTIWEDNVLLTKPIMRYAEVINIEDPDKESI